MGQEQAHIAIFTCNKIYLRLKAIRRNKGHFTTIKISINQENNTILKTNSPNTGAPSFIKSIQMEVKTQINTNPNYSK